MKTSTPYYLGDLDACLAEINDDLVLLEKTCRPSSRLKRSFVSLRLQVEAAKKPMSELNRNGSNLIHRFDTSMSEQSTSGDRGHSRSKAP
ncbi:hypothetical protein HDG33_000389 [Paraburkholderia sp. Cpub6]|nr:hypothetical protein [Paraburkholderia sp. Cpub6]